MPTSVKDIFERVGIEIDGFVRWGTPLPASEAGVYAITLASNSARNDGLWPEAPISEDRVRKWIKRVPTFTFKGRQSPHPERVVEFLKQFWLPDESIVYIGKAKSLRNRVGQFFSHTLGDRRPHAGGHWLKTLAILDKLRLYFSKCASVEEAGQLESKLLGVFVAQVSDASKAAHANPDRSFPFGNLEWHVGGNKFRKQADLHHSTLSQ